MESSSNSTSIAQITTTSTSSTSTDTTPLWLRLWFELIEPWILLFGMVTNIIVVMVMPRHAVAVARSAKIYYITIAAVDVFNLFNSWVIYTFLGDTMCASNTYYVESYTVLAAVNNIA